MSDSAHNKVAQNEIDKLIVDKANQYTNVQGQDGRTRAEGYVRGFYENIIPAVLRSDESSKESIVKAILESEGPSSPRSIMNAFEAAIAIYFLKDLKGFPRGWYQQAKDFNSEKGK